MSVLALISARGGSVRLPRKNIKEFCGRPLLEWTIEQAKNSKLIDYVCVTTDDEEIFAIAYDIGVHQVILRPKWDNDTTIGVPYMHAVDELKKQGLEFDHICTLFPTSPLRFPEDIDNMIDCYLERGCDKMDWYAPDRETFIYKNKKDMTNRRAIAYSLYPVITDKFWSYSVLSGGTGIGKAEILYNQWKENGKSDREIDKKMITEGTKPSDAYAVFPWQAFETDYKHWFEVCEVIMEKMILKGRGIELYRDYKEGHI